MQVCGMPAGQSAHEVWGSLPPGGTIREARAALAALHLQHLNRLVDLRDLVPTSVCMAGLVASLTFTGYNMILVAGSLPEIDAT